MTHSYHDIAFTPRIQALQTRVGSRGGYASMGASSRYADRLSEREVAFISQRDSFYMASVSETGWPYVQHRGGPKGFVKLLDDKTLGFVDYSGNRQYVSTGNVSHDNRVSLFFMDYPNRRRLKMFGRVRVVGTEYAEVLKQLEDPDYGAQIERAFVITIEGFDWNCPAHITPRFTEAEAHDSVSHLVAENRRLRASLSEKPKSDTADRVDAPSSVDHELGEGPLALVITGVHQLTPQVRAYEFRDPQGAELPSIEAGAHLRIPVRLPGGELTERAYSIASNPARRDIYEIAVRHDPDGRGGSRAVHDSFALGTVIRTDLPENHFGLASDTAPVVLIAGGIGITPLKPMAQALARAGTEFELHYSGRSRRDMAYLDCLERRFDGQITAHVGDEGSRLNFSKLFKAAPKDAHFYCCGPERLIVELLAEARTHNIPRSHIHLERFE